MPKVTKKLGNNKARAWESLGFAHKKSCASILTQPLVFEYFFFGGEDRTRTGDIQNHNLTL
ncbi:hypothetical protein NXX87_24295 [Bacteroides faecis]|uniref:hypothetical protein n=1 Tax=Bacteroides faecis TaxID=674529 RepID=UPI0021640711|nr:hypothetical protein [Bacteroides faecis]UVS33818.1 hypothetical protein NXX87_24295 [Bacteroides faecis]